MRNDGETHEREGRAEGANGKLRFQTAEFSTRSRKYHGEGTDGARGNDQGHSRNVNLGRTIKKQCRESKWKPEETEKRKQLPRHVVGHDAS